MKTDPVSSLKREVAATLPVDEDFVAPPARLVRLSMICVMLAMILAALSQTVVATILPTMV